jgi:hypothetical protein
MVHLTIKFALAWSIAIVIPTGLANAQDQQKLTAEQVTFFEKKIRPVLVKHCYGCHSDQAAEKQKLRGGLRLDSGPALLKGGDSGPVIVPGKPAESLLLSALRYEDFEMPPKGKLPDAVIADFVSWIEMGAADPRAGQLAGTAEVDIEAGRAHWAYQPIQRPPIPAINAASPIDAFLLSRLQRSRLQQGPLATRGQLVRRLYFDLLGLPPTPDQIAAFLADDAPAAYPRLVDQLLASPQFGERWGRHWLDVVRYAESITLRGQVFNQAWRYRDYVITTFNQDRPFNAFVHQQLAGDLLPADSRQAQRRNLVATGFLAMGNNNLEDQNKGKLRMDVVDEQLEIISRGFLAQTVGCARCHDHKFDPIPTRDYYALAGILRNTKTLNDANVSTWIELPLPLEQEQEAEVKQQEAVIATVNSEIAALKSRLQGGPASPLAVAQVIGVVVDDEQAKLTGSWTKSVYAKNYVGKGYQHDMGAAKGANTATFKPSEQLDGDYEVRFAYTEGTNRTPALPITVVSSEGEKTTTINQQKPAPIAGRFLSLGRYRFTPNGPAEVTLSNAGTTGVVIVDTVQFLSVKLLEQEAVATKSAADAAVDKKQLTQLEQRLKQLTAQLPVRPKYMSVQEEAEIGDTQIHIRGDVHNLGETVSRGILQVADFDSQISVPEKQSGRRELAEWIGSDLNPLTSRVLANRLWHWLFGAGLVRTTDNFGTTGEKPSHPQLLDYLATRLVDKEWSVKSLLRELVLSRTYQLSSKSRAEGMAVDPENRLLWRMNRRRLDAESLLDAMLSVSGRLDSSIGGSMIRAGTKNDYDYEHAGNRRAVYWPVFRNSLPDIFVAFDFANPSMVTGRRDVSSTAPQALFLMNNPWVMEQAEHTAERLLAREGLSDRERLQYAVLMTLGRPASVEELRVTLEFLAAEEMDPQLRKRAWAQIVQALFSTLDFRYNH